MLKTKNYHYLYLRSSTAFPGSSVKMTWPKYFPFLNYYSNINPNFYHYQTYKVSPFHHHILRNHQYTAFQRLLPAAIKNSSLSTRQAVTIGSIGPRGSFCCTFLENFEIKIFNSSYAVIYSLKLSVKNTFSLSLWVLSVAVVLVFNSLSSPLISLLSFLISSDPIYMSKQLRNKSTGDRKQRIRFVFHFLKLVGKIKFLALLYYIKKSPLFFKNEL